VPQSLICPNETGPKSRLYNHIELAQPKRAAALCFSAGSLAAYLACFDGHQKVFLLGYDGYTEASEDVFWVKTLTEVIDTYPMVEFVRVCPTKNFACSTELIRRLNFRQIDFRGFVTEADIG
jgi:hypothetical protein